MFCSIDRLIATCEAFQVELHGRYSVKRLLALEAHTKTTGHALATLMAVLTPVPALLAIVLTDAIPMKPIELGLAESHGFWVRAEWADLIYNVCMLGQLRFFIPALPLSTARSMALSIVVSILTTATTFGLALVIGYPIPFTIPIVSIPWVGLLSVSLWLTLRESFHTYPTLSKRLRQFEFIVVCEVCLVQIYPVFTYVYVRLPSHTQTAFVLLLSVIKVAERNMFNVALKGEDDLKPEIIVFNVEIFNALFVACTIQNSSSLVTTILLAVVDFVLGYLSFRDLNYMLQELEAVRQATGLRHDELIDSAILIARTYPESEKLISAEFNAEKSFRRHRSMRCIAVGSVESAIDADVAATPESPAAEVQIVDDHSSQLRDHPVSKLSAKKQRFLLGQVLKILYLVEFLVLIEFTEVVIPFLYSLYLAVLFQLPNRKFYPQLRDMDEDALRGKITNVMLNAGLELLSFVILCVLLHKKLRFSGLRQLSFVLQTHATNIQAKMVLWIIVSLQSSLIHLGVDYSFRFEWLQGK